MTSAPNIKQFQPFDPYRAKERSKISYGQIKIWFKFSLYPISFSVLSLIWIDLIFSLEVLKFL